jgi:hypothetical protein
MIAKLLAGYRLVFSVALVAPENASVEPASVDLVGKLRALLSDPRYTWRKLATIASKLGVAESVAADMLQSIGAGYKASRDGGRLYSYHDFDDSDEDVELSDLDDSVNEIKYDTSAGLADAEDYVESDDDSDPVDPEYAANCAKLREKLSDPRYTWRKLSTLASAIESSESDTRQHLVDIGARQDRQGRPLFKLDR